MEVVYGTVGVDWPLEAFRLGRPNEGRGRRGRKSKRGRWYGPVPLKLKVAASEGQPSFLPFPLQRLTKLTTASTAAVALTRPPLCTALFHRTPDIDWPRLSPSRYNNSVESDFPTGRATRLTRLLGHTVRDGLLETRVHRGLPGERFFEWMGHAGIAPGASFLIRFDQERSFRE
ncbi:hypothetical protein K0M31_001473 [Melipona bicolor]|uniref:Uncharacterized protein n=1 Tax=Melipona bicolor TaxID=60889 RepID=A0AA40KXT1_9HYME|nr:hypothetical protein K0M31_001473 [Melipona bicolor]